MSRFGWCLDGHHNQCRTTTSIRGLDRTTVIELVCDCECHQLTESEPTP